jgi:hypothetical protein
MQKYVDGVVLIFVLYISKHTFVIFVAREVKKKLVELK